MASQAMSAQARNDRSEVRSIALRMHKDYPNHKDGQTKASLLLRWIEPATIRDLDKYEAQEKRAHVSELVFQKESVGWGEPLRDRVMNENNACFLQVGGQVFDRGLFAHAPSTYEVKLNGQWQKFRTGYGLQDGHGGSVKFTIRGDEKVLFDSSIIRDSQLHRTEVDVTGVKTLELLVGDGGDGTSADWGVWLEPMLERQ
jgi:hypothetical protein